jgi:hypothetical protein
MPGQCRRTDGRLGVTLNTWVAVMFWFLFFVLAFGFGLGMWEYIAIKEETKRHGSAAVSLAKMAGIPLHNAYSGLPPALRWSAVRAWIFAGQTGFVIVAIAGWWAAGGFVAGFFRAIELEVLYVVSGCAIGWGIWKASGGSASAP